MRTGEDAQVFLLLSCVCLSCCVCFSEGLLEDFLSACHSDGGPERAVELLQLSAAFCLSVTPRLAKQTLAEFSLTEEQR